MTNARAMFRTQLHFEPRHKRYLEQRAQAGGTTVSGILRALIREKMARTSPAQSKNSGEWALKLARKAERMGIRGADLSTHPLG